MITMATANNTTLVCRWEWEMREWWGEKKFLNQARSNSDKPDDDALDWNFTWVISS